MSNRFPDLPKAMRRLPVDHRGFPIPFFVAWVDDEPQFPIADGFKMEVCVKYGRCWVCGGQIESRADMAAVIGPMCVVNRVSSEPPSHIACARFSARRCPFLSQPRMKRVGKGNLPHGVERPAGTMIERNPGATALYITPTIRRTAIGLFELGDPSSVEWYAQGREATRAEVLESIESGLPLLDAECNKDSDPILARHELAKMKEAAFALLPA